MKPRILIAEDSEMIQELLFSTLLRKGWDVDVAKDGEQAFRMWQDKRYDALSTDFDMPKMNGLSLSRAVLIMEPKAKVVMFSGSPEAAELFVEIGGSEFFDKADPKKFLDAMERLRSTLNDRCDCSDCEEAEDGPCSCDCDDDENQCSGCKADRAATEDAKFDADFVQGRR